jgi:hypothetical protein
MAMKFHRGYMTQITEDMSNVVKILEIKPDKAENCREGFGYDFVCPNCMERGWVLNYKERRDDPDGVTCGRCDGSGKLTAHVMIEWTAGARKV